MSFDLLSEVGSLHALNLSPDTYRYAFGIFLYPANEREVSRMLP